MFRRWAIVVAVCLVSLIAENALGVVRYIVTDMGTLPGYNSFTPLAINASGQVVGTAQVAGFSTFKAFYYDGSTMVALPATGASGINASGQIACNGGLYSGGAMVTVGFQGGGACYPVGINDQGDVVGQACTADGQYHAFLYANGQTNDLGTLGGNWSSAAAINNAGLIVGSARTTDGAIHAFLDDGTMTDLGTLAGGTSSEAQFINASGQIVGWSYTASGSRHAILCSGGQMTDLGMPAGGILSWAEGINASGVVVGDYDKSGYAAGAFVYANGSMSDLGQLIDPNSGWTIWSASAINDSGQIVATGGSTNTSGYPHALLLTPTPEPSTIALLGIATISLLAYAWRRRKGA